MDTATRPHTAPSGHRAVLRTLMELPSGIEISLDALSTEHLVTLQLDGDLSGTHLNGPIIAGAGF